MDFIKNFGDNAGNLFPVCISNGSKLSNPEPPFLKRLTTSGVFFQPQFPDMLFCGEHR
ncbi:hypothetical protein [Undibacterium sp. Tian12W]|uniref:hypothetical protein n=1 Tax=Undibacterium sp. Tian12W TaxID=3413054 RepID=UPI003BF2EA53